MDFGSWVVDKFEITQYSQLFGPLRLLHIRSIVQVLQVIAARPKAIPSPAPVFKLLDAPFAPPVLQAHASIVHLLVHPTSPPPLLGGPVKPVHAQAALLVRESIHHNESGACFGGGSGLPFGCLRELQEQKRRMSEHARASDNIDGDRLI